MIFKIKQAGQDKGKFFYGKYIKFVFFDKFWHKGSVSMDKLGM